MFISSRKRERLKKQSIRKNKRELRIMLRQRNYGRLTEEETAKLMIKLQTEKTVNLLKKLIVKNSVVRLRHNLQYKPKTRGISYEQ